MKIELTSQQLRRLFCSIVNDAPYCNDRWLKSFWYLLEKKKGVDEYDEKYQGLIERKLAVKVGGMIYLRGKIDGENKLTSSGQTGRKKTLADTPGRYEMFWKSHGGEAVLATERPFLKKFVSNYSFPEFVKMSVAFMKNYQGVRSLFMLWKNRKYFGGGEVGDE